MREAFGVEFHYAGNICNADLHRKYAFSPIVYFGLFN